VAIFGQEVVDHIIIVRSNFPKFSNSEKCLEDQKRTIRESKEIREMITSASDFIYVDNPPISEEEEENEHTNNHMMSQRIQSREKLLSKLKENIDIYKEPESLVKLGEKVIKHIIRERRAIEKLEEPKAEEIKKIYREIKNESCNKYSRKIEEYVQLRVNEQQNCHNFQEQEGSTARQNIAFGVGLLGIFFGKMINGIVG
jgi:hypothetical protein